MLQVILKKLQKLFNCKDLCSLHEGMVIVCLFGFIFGLFFGLLLASYQIAGAAVLFYSSVVFFLIFWWLLALDELFKE